VPGDSFTHPALFYADLDEYLAGVGGFVQEGLAAGEPVFVSVPPDRHAPLRDYLGADAARVELHNMAEVGRNPGRILTALTDFAARRGTGRARLVGEPIWATRTPREIREATRHEALINLAFATIPVTILCPYDTSRLSPQTLADARRTHPVLWSRDGRWPSDAYTDPYKVSADCDTLPDSAPSNAIRIAFGPAELASVRKRAEQFGRTSGLSESRTVDLKLAVGEAAANAIRHGGGAGKISLWSDGFSVIVEIRDSGRLPDPLAGRFRPATAATRGRGLWLMHQLCDLVELGPGVIRLHMALRD
jgi:anti-sigma regulatory factor (Ser/Thr protein kinase)